MFNKVLNTPLTSDNLLYVYKNDMKISRKRRPGSDKRAESRESDKPNSPKFMTLVRIKQKRAGNIKYYLRYILCN